MHQGKIWVVGGHVEGRASTSVLIYDADADTWATGPPLPTPQRYCPATAIDGRIYLFGRDAVFRYERGAWSEIPGVDARYGSTCGAVLLG